jgi:hypothetical protein
MILERNQQYLSYPSGELNDDNHHHTVSALVQMTGGRWVRRLPGALSCLDQKRRGRRRLETW